MIAKESYPLSFGYNGIIRNYPDLPEILNNRDLKLIYTEHAERNAIYNAVRNGINISGASMYVTHMPCHECCRAILQSGITTVHTLYDPEYMDNSKWTESIKFTKDMFITTGCNLFIHDPENDYAIV